MFERIQVTVMLCCNDPRNGLFTGHLSAIEVGPNMKFQTPGIWDEHSGPRLRYLWEPGRFTDNARIAISGRYFPVVHHRSWFGNWCWDAVNMRGSTVLTLLNWMRGKPWFDLEEAETRLWNQWEAAHPFEDHDLRLINNDFGIC